MPLPKPRKGESQDDFIDRCHAEIADEFEDSAQRHAVCMDAWRDGQDGQAKMTHIKIDCPQSRPWGPAERPIFQVRGATFAVDKDGEDKTTVYLYDEIGIWGVSHAAFAERLAEIDSPQIDLRINSPGGDFFDAVGMYNDLIDHPAHVTAHVTGVAASAASILAMAADRVEIGNKAKIMIHNAWALSIGNRHAHRAAADFLESLDDDMIDIYAMRSGADAADVRNWMDEETWFAGAAAVTAGLADGVAASAKRKADAKASYDLSVYARCPEDLLERDDDVPPTKRDLERALREAGCSRTQARAMLAKGFDTAFAKTPRDAGEVAVVINEAADVLARLKALHHAGSYGSSGVDR